MSLSVRPAFEVYFANTKDKRVIEHWKDFVKANYKGKLKRDKKSDEYYAKELTAPAVYTGQFDLYSRIDKAGDDVVFKVWFDLGAAFLNEQDHPSNAKEVKAMLRTFYFELRREQQTGLVKEHKDSVKDAEKTLAKLVKKNKDLQKDIENYRKKILTAEKDILKNEREQKDMRTLLETHKKALKDANNKLDKVEKGKSY